MTAIVIVAATPTKPQRTLEVDDYRLVSHNLTGEQVFELHVVAPTAGVHRISRRSLVSMTWRNGVWRDCLAAVPSGWTPIGVRRQLAFLEGMPVPPRRS
jgi:hypothetical protein